MLEFRAIFTGKTSGSLSPERMHSQIFGVGLSAVSAGINMAVTSTARVTHEMASLQYNRLSTMSTTTPPRRSTVRTIFE